MNAKSAASFRVGGREFRLWFAKTPNGFSTGCDAVEGSSPLGSVVGTVWMRDPEALLRAIDGRTGMSIEGNIAFGYGGDADPELAPGVTVMSFDQEETVSEAFFERFTVEYGLAAIDAAKSLEIEAGQVLKPVLLERRARLGPDAA